MSLFANWKSNLTNVPPLTKSVVTAMTVLSLLGQVLKIRGMLQADMDHDGVPEMEIPSVYLINAALFLGCGKYLERAWGSRELFKYMAVSSIGTMVAVYITCLSEYLIRDNSAMMDVHAHGLTCLLAGFLVGFKQLVPEHLITLVGALSIRVKSLPLLFAVFMAVVGVVFSTQVQFLMALYGLLISWTYARFIKVADGAKGDRSETFSLASFFPEILQPPVKVVSNFFFGLLVKAKICSPIGYAGFHYDLENPQMSGMGHTFTQPGSLRAEAERRRALALKALDMRLHAAAGNSGSGVGGSRTTFSASVGGSALGSSSSPATSSSGAAPVSLLSLSADPVLPASTDLDDDDEVLFDADKMDERPLSSVVVVSKSGTAPVASVTTTTTTTDGLVASVSTATSSAASTPAPTTVASSTKADTSKSQ
ncbi:hypothetical protein DFQ27_008962 [Actinomortierella ambigua]|uniref:DUF1751-domain-containing protein n=1 Tax=Actinomortierella ambigua TaxID=1343610 RepID=A0A9P6PRS4_9FUNG|nr:hypothetical protein DFQ27_008962 [Actinomortierella ambigua]